MDEENMTISEQVIETVATATDRDPLELPALFHSIDPDALDSLVATMESGEFFFEYAGFSVTITRKGSLRAVSI